VTPWYSYNKKRKKRDSHYQLQLDISPKAWAAIPILPQSSVCMAILKPIPGSPNKLAYNDFINEKYHVMYRVVMAKLR
jgi:hypothetical protein